MSSDFCIKCDNELSVYCGPCVDAIRKELDDARAQLQGQGTGLTALDTILGHPKDGLVEAVKGLVKERDDYKAKLDAELPAAWREDLASLDAIIERTERERDTLIRMLVSEFGWQDTSYLHAVMHVENAVRNLRADLSVALKERDDYKAKYEFMVERAVNEKLDGYRELGQRAADAENARDKALAERDEACEELETLKALIEGETWAGAVMKRQRDEAREQVAALRAGLEERGCRPIPAGNDCTGCKALAATESETCEHGVENGGRAVGACSTCDTVAVMTETAQRRATEGFDPPDERAYTVGDAIGLKRQPPHGS